MSVNPTELAELAERASTLRALHVPGRPLVLPNAWDAGSAKLVAAAGFPVVATTSAGVAEALGYTDHEGAPVDEMLAVAARITRVVGVPVTVDAEAGYGLPAAELVERLLAVGVVGCNLEDSDPATGELVEVARHADYLAGVRAAADAAGVPLVVNARVDVFLRNAGTADESTVLATALTRARAYLAAGADCVYPILARQGEVLAEFVAELAPAPVNVMSVPGGFTPQAAAELGAGRVSLAASLFRGMQAELANRLSALATSLTD